VTRTPEYGDALGREWHEAADHILICEGRFRGEADMHGRVAMTACVVGDSRRSSGRIRGTGFMEYRRRDAASFRLDVCRTDHLGPLLGLLGNVFAKVGGRANKGRASQVGEPCLDPGIGETGIDLLVEIRDDLCKRILGCAEAIPVARNVPPARIPGDGSEPLDDLPANAEEIRVALLDAFDRQRRVDLAARLVARYLTLRRSAQALIAMLARSLLREDAGFHAYQVLDAGVWQFGEWGNTDEGRYILIAVARYLAAHSPTERAELQTADIARRLMRGGELHQDATA
jgi:hypothetical protein